MKKWNYFGMFLFFAFFIFSGCSRIDTGNDDRNRFVSQIDVVYTNEEGTQLFHYTTPEKMQTILLYLRLLKPEKQATLNPERLTGSVYKITVHFSNGQQCIYRQRADRFLSKNAKPWQEIDRQQAQTLPRLLKKLPSDSV